jgi:hypothetical protein
METIESQPMKPSKFMRNAIERTVDQMSNPKVEVTIKVNLTNTNHYSHDFGIETTISKDFKSAIIPFFEAVEHLQREIDKMNKV